VTGDADLLVQTLGELSSWQTGRPEAIDVRVEVDLPSLRWALRGYPRASFLGGGETSLPGAGQGLPSALITHQTQDTPSLASAYRGQDFIWSIYPAWSGGFPPDFFRWLVFRQSPVQQDQLILWARSDLFPGGELAPQDSSVQDNIAQPRE
jgi:hypothetical protein